MAYELAPEILRVITSPYAVSLINLDSTLNAAGPREIQAWSDSHPCQINALADAVVDALQYCPFTLSVIEKLGIVEQLRDAMLQQKPILLDTLIRNALQDDMNFEKFSPTLVAFLSNPLPPKIPPPAKLVAFFLKCLERATKTPTVKAIRPLYVLVANGYKHLTLQMSESQSYNFTKRMTGFLMQKGSMDMNVFLTYCLATLAHMHLASGNTGGEAGDERKHSAIGEIFQGKKAPTVLNLVINMVNHFASPEIEMNWQEKVQIIRMNTVIANAVSDSVKATGTSGVGAANVRRLLEKIKAQGNTHGVPEVLQFVSALSLMTPQPPLKETIQELVCRDRKEETTDMFLPVISVGFFAHIASQDVIGDMIHSVIKRSSTNCKLTPSLHLLLQGRISFIQQLSKSIPQCPNIRRGVLGALSTRELATSIDGFVRHTVEPPAANDACGGSNACRWAISSLASQLQLTFCTFILRCVVFSQGDSEGKLSPNTTASLVEKLAKLSATRPGCPFEHTLRTRSAHDSLSLIEESASPEARITSQNWRQGLMSGLSRDKDRQHAYVISTVGEICRDLESRCENVEKPLRAEEENSRRLQAELDEYKAKFAEIQEQLGQCLHNLDHTTEENERLENKLDGAIAKSRESFDRVRKLEDALETEREESKQIIEDLERAAAEARSARLEELRVAQLDADRAAMDSMSMINARQNMIEELEEKNRGLEQEASRAKDEIACLQEKKDHLEKRTETAMGLLEEAQQELHGNRDQMDTLREEKLRLQSTLEETEGSLTDVRQALKDHKLSLEHRILDLDQQDQLVDELVYRGQQQKELVYRLTRSRDELEMKAQELEKMVEKIIHDSEQKREDLSTELVFRHERQLSKVNGVHEKEMEQRQRDHKAEIDQLKFKLDRSRKEWSRERDVQRAEVKSLNESLIRLRETQEEREKGARDLSRQLLGLMSGPNPDLASLLGGGASVGTLDSLPGPVATRSPLQIQASCNGRPAMPPAAVPARRRKSSDHYSNNEDNEINPKRSRTTHHTLAPGQQQQAHLDTKVVEASHGGRSEPPASLRKTSVVVAEHSYPSEEMVRDTPTSPAETNYGTAPVLTSTPKLDLSTQGVWEQEIVGGRKMRRKGRRIERGGEEDGNGNDDDDNDDDDDGDDDDYDYDFGDGAEDDYDELPLFGAKEFVQWEADETMDSD